MTRSRTALAWTLLGAALSLSAAPPRSLYAPPPKPAGHAASEEPAPESADASQPTAAMEEKFRKLQKEMGARPSAAPVQGPSSPPGPGSSVPPSEDSASASAESPSTSGLGLRVLFSLVFVLLLAVVAIRGLKRLQGRLLTRTAVGGDMLEVLEICHLGPQQKVVAVRMHDEVGVLGVTKEGIRLLTVLKRPAEEIRQAHRPESNPAAFSDSLNKLLDRFKKPKRVSDMLDETKG